ncbi:DUF2238 domain-containing protein [Alloalcanivorax xenomutans]|jgi:putative membrane protein|uniref:DUF2238 domain-containing protein n=1 Tax=Alloalcanivorax xenomutans TaxID=1094342 RepID=UPI001F430907|nr:DUF2238 domain-containing protein [Alloalcanivorax xenomutans]MCE7522399.1 DUF2238 domain-containing protein [Alloalcanivorax xenomutans]
MSGRAVFMLLLSLLAVFVVWMAVEPHDRADWMLENALVLLAVVALIVTRRWFVFSNQAYLLIFAFLALHELGSHYTYSLVPYDPALRKLFGFSLDQLMGWERNQFDRLVHLAYGLLLTIPLFEFCRRAVGLGRGWGYVFASAIIMATSMLYELIEWIAAVWFGGDLGQAFLGTQGDIWDAQKDMALASIGAVLAVVLHVLLQRRSAGADTGAPSR